MKVKYRTYERDVKCMNPDCNHRFRSRIAKPRCSKCYSCIVTDIKDLPREYGGQTIKNLREEVNELKKSKEFNLRMFKKIIGRIKALEGK